MKHPFLTIAAAGLFTVATVQPAQADEGMWTFDNPPRAQVKASYGVDLDDAWLQRVRLGAVRIDGGCSASLVSSAAWVALRPMLNPARVASEALARPQRVTVAAATPDAARAPTPMATGALNTPAAPSAAVPTTPAADDACQRPVSVSPAR